MGTTKSSDGRTSRKPLRLDAGVAFAQPEVGLMVGEDRGQHREEGHIEEDDRAGKNEKATHRHNLSPGARKEARGLNLT